MKDIESIDSVIYDVIYRAIVALSIGIWGISIFGTLVYMILCQKYR